MKRCLEWKACRQKHGYGVLWRDGKLRAAHREMYEAWYGPIPPGMHVLHKCDNPPCINPDHLFLGTAGDNVRDMINKHRGPHGEKTCNAKLNAANVDYVRRMKGKLSQSQIARNLGISRTNVSAIHTGRSWKHLL